MKDEFNEFEKELWAKIAELKSYQRDQEKIDDDLRDVQQQLSRALGWISNALGEE